MADGSSPSMALCKSLGEWVKQWTVAYDQIEKRLQGKESYVNDGKEETADARCPILYHALTPSPKKGKHARRANKQCR